ncbi:MAG: GHKL domain-containing protein [Acetatifactor muris]|nr:GHKL domain-containing protein [Acetatifactor muris]
MMLIIRHLFSAELRMPLFLTFFYEITVALWEFMLSASLGILFRSEGFLDRNMPGYVAAVWIVRALMLGIAVLAAKAGEGRNRVISVVAIAGLFGVIFLSGQSIITIDDEQMTTWIIFSMLILVAVLFFYLTRQYEMEKKIADLEKEKNALLIRDYQLLKNTYAANARLFHDFHNHIEALHRYLEKDRTAEAVQYLESLRSPIEAVTQPVWVGDEAVDYLINSKITLAASQEIQVKCNIEYPQHTNIRSVDLVVILGNLLDNALEAVESTEGDLRFINLTIRRINEMLVIKMENGCNATPTVADGDLQTSKTDKTLHGWGLQSVRTAAGRYDGIIETEYSNHIFRAVVTLSFEAVKA